MKVTFGKFKGKDIEDIPNSYLQWASENFDNMSDELTEAINEELKYRKQFDIVIK